MNLLEAERAMKERIPIVISHSWDFQDKPTYITKVHTDTTIFNCEVEGGEGKRFDLLRVEQYVPQFSVYKVDSQNKYFIRDTNGEHREISRFEYVELLEHKQKIFDSKIKA